MNKGKVIFKDFGKVTTDTENRDETLKAYICAILDIPAIQFDDVIPGIKTEKERAAFIDMVYNDMKGRIRRLSEGK